MITPGRFLGAGLLALTLVGCSALQRDLPETPPPLADMEEPLPLQRTPDDEAERLALPLGVFTGVYVTGGEQSLDDLFEGSPGVTVTRVVENSPAAIAGLREGDVLLEAEVPGRAGAVELRFPSQWRDLELEAAPGDVVRVVIDRAGAARSAEIATVRRVAAPERDPVERFREEDRVGVVVRTATEVEARRAGLAPGGGAVVVGLSRGSPWRAAGLRFEDLVVAADGRPIDHPQVLLEIVAAAETGDVVALDVDRAGERTTIAAPVSERESDFTEFSIPLLYSYESDRGRSESSLLFGLFGHERTEAAWRTRLLWFITFGGGDADSLEEVDPVDPAAMEDGARP